MMDQETVMIEVDRIEAETDAAFLLVVDGGKVKEWVPKSQIANPDCYDVGDEEFEMEVTKWIADKKEFGYDDI